FVPGDDGNPCVGAQAIEVRTATSACIGDVGQIRVSDVANHRARCAVVGTILAPKSLGVASRRGGDHVLHARVAACCVVAEMLRRANGFGRKLRLARVGRCGAGVVGPDSGKNARWIPRLGARAIDTYRASRNALAVLRYAIGPGAAADPVVEGLENRRLATRIIVVPLRAPQNEIDFRTRFNANAADSTMVSKIASAAGLLPHMRI